MENNQQFSATLKQEAEDSGEEYETVEIIEEADIDEAMAGNSINIEKKSKPMIVQMSKAILLRNTSDNSPDGSKELEENSHNTEGGKQKWTRESTNLLISMRSELDEHFENPKCRKMDYWDYISTLMSGAGFHISSHDCHTKWRNLCGTYRMNKEKSHRLGNATIRWEFYDQMDKFMKKKQWIDGVEPKDSDHIDDEEEDLEDSDDDAEMSRLLRLQSGVSEKRNLDTTEHTNKRLRSESPPQWFKDYIKNKEEEDKLRDERFFSILESIKESELRKTALLESLLQYFDRS